MEQYGVITETGGDSASVNIQRHLICGECGKCGILSGADRRIITVEALNPIQAEKGQRVVLESDDRQVIFIAFMLYIVPLIGLVVGILGWPQLAGSLGYQDGQDLQAVVVGLVIMIAIFLQIRKWDRRVKDDPRYKPVITGLLLDKQDCGDETAEKEINSQEDQN